MTKLCSTKPIVTVKENLPVLKNKALTTQEYEESLWWDQAWRPCFSFPRASSKKVGDRVESDRSISLYLYEPFQGRPCLCSSHKWKSSFYRPKSMRMLGEALIHGSHSDLCQRKRKKPQLLFISFFSFDFHILVPHFSAITFAAPLSWSKILPEKHYLIRHSMHEVS